jgi:hypothetical protein
MPWPLRVRRLQPPACSQNNELNPGGCGTHSRWRNASLCQQRACTVLSVYRTGRSIFRFFCCIVIRSPSEIGGSEKPQLSSHGDLCAIKLNASTEGDNTSAALQESSHLRLRGFRARNAMALSRGVFDPKHPTREVNRLECSEIISTSREEAQEYALTLCRAWIDGLSNRP